MPWRLERGVQGFAIVSAFVLATFVAVGPGCTADPASASVQIFSNVKSGQTIEVLAGKVFAIDFPITLGTGHKRIVVDPLPSFLRFSLSEFLAAGPEFLAADKRQRVTFEVMDAGEGTVSLAYRRPFEAAKVQDEKFNVKVITK